MHRYRVHVYGENVCVECKSVWFSQAMSTPVAAIPAVIAYNKLSTDISRFAGRLEAFAGEFGAILSRQAEAGD